MAQYAFQGWPLSSCSYEDLTNSIQAGYFIKNGIANYNYASYAFGVAFGFCL
mgnify:CR=1 FL=1